MSRSRKKTPVHGITCKESEKEDKRRANRKLRRKVRAGEDVTLREVSNPWAMAKDGKARFDPKKYPKGMRK